MPSVEATDGRGSERRLSYHSNPPCELGSGPRAQGGSQAKLTIKPLCCKHWKLFKKGRPTSDDCRHEADNGGDERDDGGGLRHAQLDAEAL
jgi:hypothetical protein